MKKLSNGEAELKEALLMKKKHVIVFFIPINIFTNSFSEAPYKVPCSLKKFVGLEVAQTQLVAMKSFRN